MTRKAPPFSLQDTSGKEITLPKKGVVVLYFYPKADTPGCTKESKAFSELYPQFIEAGALVLGVSPDAHKKICSFHDKYSFSHELLADPEHTAAEAYGVWTQKSMFGNKYMGVKRTTFVIKDGKILKEYKHKPGKTEQEVLEYVQEL